MEMFLPALIAVYDPTDIVKAVNQGVAIILSACASSIVVAIQGRWQNKQVAKELSSTDDNSLKGIVTKLSAQVADHTREFEESRKESQAFREISGKFRDTVTTELKKAAKERASLRHKVNAIVTKMAGM